MLFGQIDQGVLKRISAEVKVDLKLASLTLREASRPAPTREAKLKIVERFIDAHHHVGTIQEPGNEYFRGRMDMRWGYLGVNAVCFQGIDPQSSHGVFLVGSRHHVLGEMRPNSDYGAASNLPGIMGIIGIMGIPGRLYDLAKRGGKFSHFPKQHLEFLAIPLTEDEFDEQSEGELDRQADAHIVLGTPLYVAIAR